MNPWLGFFVFLHPLPPTRKEPSMIHISKLSDRHHLLHDPELYREVISYLLYCHHESMEDNTDDHDFNLLHRSPAPSRSQQSFQGRLSTQIKKWSAWSCVSAKTVDGSFDIATAWYRAVEIMTIFTLIKSTGNYLMPTLGQKTSSIRQKMSNIKWR